MRTFSENELTEAVIARFEDCDDERLKRIMTSLVRHLHSFVKDVQLTEEEWTAAIRFLTDTGQKCDGKRQEYILLSDVLGVSMLVDAINHRRSAGATDSTVLGPFYVTTPADMPLGADIAKGMAGEPLYCSGIVRGTDGKPVVGALVDVWQSDAAGFYDVQKADLDEHNLRARFRTGTDGRYWFWSIKPASYPVPTDGPVGRLLRASHRHPYRPAHVHFLIEAPGYERLVTHVFVDGDPYLDSDAVFGVKKSLIKPFVKRPAGTGPDGRAITREYYEMAYDFGLEPTVQKRAHWAASLFQGRGA